MFQVHVNDKKIWYWIIPGCSHYVIIYLWNSFWILLKLSNIRKEPDCSDFIAPKQQIIGLEEIFF